MRQVYLEGDLQVDGFSYSADVGLPKVSGNTDLGGFCTKTNIWA